MGMSHFAGCPDPPLHHEKKFFLLFSIYIYYVYRYHLMHLGIYVLHRVMGRGGWWMPGVAFVLRLVILGRANTKGQSSLLHT